jgi:hypothetical protein
MKGKRMNQQESYLVVEEASPSILFSWFLNEELTIEHRHKFDGDKDITDEKIVLFRDGGKS